MVEGNDLPSPAVTPTNLGGGFSVGALAKKHLILLPEQPTEWKLKSSLRRLKSWLPHPVSGT